MKTYVALINFLLAFIATLPNPGVSVPKNLSLPKPELCAARKIHTKLGTSGYYFTWLEKDTRNLFLNWLDARNWCRERCMDLVSLETPQEIQLIKEYIQLHNTKYSWTSGRLCDFGEKCSSRKDLQPPEINGWFWSGSGLKMRPTNEHSTYNDWSHTGGLKLPQPDNREKKEGGHPESCLAYLNNYYKDGIKWHDVACHHIKSFVCEDSVELLKYARSINRNSGLQF
ncbi:unnamed protein product [Allacma fusca]|uniref:C-type lectin domain-containing protein n=1 Tax=Allacma fusca TaxID=39272 RepID=A0A8J2NSD8_9HEXA|nr:unnamed protein product [Allacma fusca]